MKYWNVTIQSKFTLVEVVFYKIAASDIQRAKDGALDMLAHPDAWEVAQAVEFK